MLPTIRRRYSEVRDQSGVWDLQNPDLTLSDICCMIVLFKEEGTDNIPGSCSFLS